MPQNEIQQKLMQYQALENTLQELSQRREIFGMRLMEIEQTKQALDEIKDSKDSDVFVPLGSSVFLPGKLKEKEKMIVEVGADVALEKEPDQVKRILEEKKKILEEGLEDLQKDMMNIVKQMRTIQPELQKAMSQQQKPAG